MNSDLDRKRTARRARWSTALVGASGLFGIALCGGIAGVLGGAALLLCVVGWSFTKPVGVGFFRWTNPLVSLGLFLGPLLLGLDWVSAGIILVLYLQVFKAWTAGAARDYRVCLLLALLMALLASTLTRSILFAGTLGLLALVTPVALIQLHFWEMESHRPARPALLTSKGRTTATLALGPVALVGMLIFFLIIPRFRGGYLANSDDVQSLAGFTSDVSLGDIGAIKDNPSMVMRVEAERLDGSRPRGPFYFRGMALDLFDGNGWKKSAYRNLLRSAEGPPHRVRDSDLRMEILLEPLDEPVLFGVPEVKSMHVPELAVREGRLSNFLYFGEARRVPYTVWSRESAATQEQIRAKTSNLRETDLQRFTALPPDLDPRIPALAKEIVGDAEGPFAKSYAIEQWLRDEFTYTLVPEAGTGRQPLLSFLFETRKGHCEYFATALAVLLRAEGVPAVLVSGFYGGEWNELGDYLVVRQADAHAWVEIHAGDAWVQRDATPAGAISPPGSGWLSQLGNLFSGWWERRILDYDLYAQAETVGGFSSLFGLNLDRDNEMAFPKAISATLMVCLLGLFLLSRLGRLLLAERARRVHRVRGIAGIYAKARIHARRQGWRIPGSLTHLEAAQWLRAEAGESAAPLVDLAWFHYRSHYGPESEKDLLSEAKDALLAFRADLPEAVDLVDDAEDRRYR